MTRRQARLFAIVITALAVVAFIALTVDSHRKFGALTNAQNITPQVLAGKDVWHENNCTNCHTLFGEGAYYAPDLTKITLQRGATYLKAFMRDPAQFYDEQVYRRVMPQQNLSDREIDDLIAFLDWIAHVDNQGWPPRPILVSGAAIPGTDLGSAAAATPASNDPVAQGQGLFRASPPGCFACHSTAPGVNLAGPSLAGIGAGAAKRIEDPAYRGQATDAAGYLRESIVNPNAHLVTGAAYSIEGQSLMPVYAGQLSDEQVDQLVAFLGTLH